MKADLIAVIPRDVQLSLSLDPVSGVTYSSVVGEVLPHVRVIVDYREAQLSQLYGGPTPESISIWGDFTAPADRTVSSP